MASDDHGDKTEDPTQHRRDESRKKGNVVRSVDLNAATLMLAAASVLMMFGAGLSRAMAELLRKYLETANLAQLEDTGVVGQFWGLASWAASNVLPLLVAMMLAALVINLAQVGFLIAPEALQPKLGRLNPLEGAKRILSVQGLVKLAVNLGKIVLLVMIAGWCIWSELPHFIDLSGGDAYQISAQIARSTVWLGYVLATVLIILAILDYSFQRWKHEQDLLMTKQEVRDEMKNMDGDPHIRQRRRDAHRKLAQSRDMQQVKDADVVITNPTHISVAIKYDPSKMEAPVVVAKGADNVAMRIRELAREHGVPIIERRELARALYGSVKVGHSIPVEMYEVFVEIMAYVYRITKRKPPKLD